MRLNSARKTHILYTFWKKMINITVPGIFLILFLLRLPELQRMPKALNFEYCQKNQSRL